MLPGYMMIRRTLPVFVLALMAPLTTALAQEGPGGLVNPQRDCMTIRTCNYDDYGPYRGCLSTYSCRVCKLVPASCEGMPGRVCKKMRCSWGGVS